MIKVGDIIKFEGRRFKAIPYTECKDCVLGDDLRINCVKHMDTFYCLDEHRQTHIMFKELTFNYGK